MDELGLWPEAPHTHTHMSYIIYKDGVLPWTPGLDQYHIGDVKVCIVRAQAAGKVF